MAEEEPGSGKQEDVAPASWTERVRQLAADWSQRRRTASRTVRRLIALWPDAGLGLMTVYVVLCLAGAALPLAFTVGSGLLVNDVVAYLGHPGSGSARQSVISTLYLLGTIFVAQQLVATAASPVRLLAINRVNLRVRERVRRVLVEPIGIAHVEDSELQDAMERFAESQRGFTVAGATVGIVQLATNYLGAIGSFLIVARFSLLLALALTVLVITLRERFRIQMNAAIESMWARANSMRRRFIETWAATSPEFAKDYKLFGLTDWAVDRINHWWVHSTELFKLRRDAMIRDLGGFVVVIAIGYAVSAAVIVLAAARHQVSLGEMTVYLEGAIALAGLAGIDNALIDIDQGSRGFEVLDRLEAVARGDAPTEGIDPGQRPSEFLAFEDVHFRYPRTDRLILDGVDLRLEAGTSTAIVGANGSGKTTMVKLLGRLYEPEVGRLVVDGIPVRDFDDRAWQRQVAVISQDFLRYPFSAAENIAFGAVEHLDDREGTINAARRAGALDIIERLPLGFQTLLVRSQEEGVDLSGGEWQRVALARALFAVDHGAGILVMDEPTASLDVRAEAEMFERFLELTAGATTIIISHRFSTVRRAQRIVVLHEGRIVEDGDHDSLMAAAGRYAEMFNLQAERFAAGLDLETGQPAGEPTEVPA
jgi:ATP-binding cassette subfamily B protein